MVNSHEVVYFLTLPKRLTGGLFDIDVFLFQISMSVNKHSAISMPTVLIQWVPMNVNVGKVFLEMALTVQVNSSKPE